MSLAALEDLRPALSREYGPGELDITDETTGEVHRIEVPSGANVYAYIEDALNRMFGDDQAA